VVIDLPRAFLQIAREVKTKTFRPRVVELGEESHVVTLVLNQALSTRIPPTARARIDSLQTLMLAGQYKVHVDTSAAKK
jgi:basic membrane lipoprotein Med (substrate-binding protein (PBP1-ABC) superfamily)